MDYHATRESAINGWAGEGLMVVVVTAPLGSVTSQAFNQSHVAFNSKLALNVQPLTNNNLTVISGAGDGQGATISRRFSKNEASGFTYWEFTWNLLNQNMPGGIGIASTTLLDLPDPTPAYQAFSEDGTGGVLLKATGEIWAFGSMISPSNPGFAQISTDTIGFSVQWGPDKGNAVGLWNFRTGFFGAGIRMPNDNYLPFVVFGNAPVDVDYQLTANFMGPDFVIQGTDFFQDFDPGTVLGWLPD